MPHNAQNSTEFEDQMRFPAQSTVPQHQIVDPVIGSLDLRTVPLFDRRTRNQETVNRKSCCLNQAGAHGGAYEMGSKGT
jgi:hypothetical protein